MSAEEVGDLGNLYPTLPLHASRYGGQVKSFTVLVFRALDMGCFGDFSRFGYLKAAFGQETRPSREADVSDDTSLLKSVSCSCGAAYFGSLKDAVS